MSDKTLKRDVRSSGCTDVGPGDFIKVGSQWKEIESNTAHGEARTPRYWDVTTTDGQTYGPFDIKLYAKAEDMEDLA